MLHEGEDPAVKADRLPDRPFLEMLQDGKIRLRPDRLRGHRRIQADAVPVLRPGDQGQLRVREQDAEKLLGVLGDDEPRIGVEGAERRPPDERRVERHRDDVPFGRKVGDPGAVPELVVERVSSPPPVEEEDRKGGDVDVRMRVEHGERLAAGVAGEDVVRVAEVDDAAGREREAGLAGRGLAGVALVQDGDVARVAAGERVADCAGAVGRAVVDENELDVAPEPDVLPLHAPEEVAQVRRDVEDGRYNGKGEGRGNRHGRGILENGAVRVKPLVPRSPVC